MNPLKWKREHRLALCVAATIGALVGVLVAYCVLLPHFLGGCSLPRGGVNFGCLLFFYWGRVWFWPVAGAVIGAGIVYVRQLLR